MTNFILIQVVFKLRGGTQHIDIRGGGGVSPRILRATKKYQLIFNKTKNINSINVLYLKISQIVILDEKVSLIKR